MSNRFGERLINEYTSAIRDLYAELYQTAGSSTCAQFENRVRKISIIALKMRQRGMEKSRTTKLL